MANYLYNGWELPPLPKWDKTQYPYAVISIWHEGTLTNPWTIASLYLSNVPLYGESVSFSLAEIKRTYAKQDGSMICYRWDSMDDDDNLGFVRYESRDAAIVADTSLGFGVDWANHDILHYTEDGTLYLSASEPVPVNPPDPPDPLSVLLGWRVGRAIRNMRR